MRISDWSSDVCSSDLLRIGGLRIDRRNDDHQRERHAPHDRVLPRSRHCLEPARHPQPEIERAAHRTFQRSEEHTSELQSLMRISYAVFCFKKKTTTDHKQYSMYAINSTIHISSE